MGEEINETEFTEADFAAFTVHLRSETAELTRWFESNRFVDAPLTIGFELETWLVDHSGQPAPINDQLLARLNHPLVTPELSRFNVEINSTPQVLTGQVFSVMQAELTATCLQAQAVAHELGAQLVMTGILPTVGETDLCLANISGLNRYRALNRQVMRLRRGRPLTIAIEGIEQLRTVHHDVMLEAATTSFQIHLQVPPAQAASYYNQMLTLSGPVLAGCSNSPLLFGKTLWAETRVPLFEQAVAVGSAPESEAIGYPRVTFGTGFVKESLLECFMENLVHYPALLPTHLGEGAKPLPHLRLHNGTIWRWNRPLIGFAGDGRPHLRIEHRPLPSGPTLIDQFANAALFAGVVAERVATDETLPTSFAESKCNFYAAARDGLQAMLTWNGRQIGAQEVLLEVLLPQAAAGLARLGVASSERDHYLGVIEERVKSGRTGAYWQQAFLQRHGRDPLGLLSSYIAHQQAGNPVHEWPDD